MNDTPESNNKKDEGKKTKKGGQTHGDYTSVLANEVDPFFM